MLNLYCWHATFSPLLHLRVYKEIYIYFETIYEKAFIAAHYPFYTGFVLVR